MPADFLRSRVERAPLSTRAWVFQERILAPRTIHCTKSQVLWECYESWSSESHPVSIRPLYPVKSPGLDITRSSMFERSTGSERLIKGRRRWKVPTSDTVNILKRWSGVIESYGRKRITFPRDKLVACSAITKATSPVLWKFVAGLWKAHLASQLLWYRHRGTEYYAFGWTEDGRMRPRQPPSWSWASIDGEVRLPAYKHGYEAFGLPFGYLVNHPPMIEILNVDVTHRSKDTTGAVTEGTIRLRGHVLPLFRHSDETYPFHFQPPKPDDLGYLVIRWDRVEGKKEHRADRSAATSEILQRRAFHDLPTGAMAPLPWSQTPEASSFVAVPVMMSFGDIDRVTGLVLQRTRAVRGKYRRCGFFHTSPEYYDRLKSVQPKCYRVYTLRTTVLTEVTQSLLCSSSLVVHVVMTSIEGTDSWRTYVHRATTPTRLI